MSLSKVLYTATATAEGGREGRTASDDGRLDVVVSVPKEMGGPGSGTNPEQLFAAGFAACFHSALKLVARGAGHDVADSTVTAGVGIGPEGDGYNIRVDLEIALPGMAPSVAEDLVRKADAVCPYSNATRGNIDVTHRVA